MSQGQLQCNDQLKERAVLEAELKGSQRQQTKIDDLKARVEELERDLSAAHDSLEKGAVAECFSEIIFKDSNAISIDTGNEQSQRKEPVGKPSAAHIQLETLKAGSSGDAVSFAEAQGNVTALEAKLSMAQCQLADVNVEVKALQDASTADAAISTYVKELEQVFCLTAFCTALEDCGLLIQCKCLP